MIVLALDPSSTAIGWARAEDGVVTGAGVRRPAKGDPHSVMNIVDSLIVERDEVRCRDGAIVIEIPSSRCYRSTGHGLAKYGFAAGSAYATAMILAARVVPVEAEKWTGGRSKIQRRQIALKAFPGLAKIKDSGYDASDAIALLEWYRQNGGGAI